MAARPRLRVNADVLEAALAGRQGAEFELPSKNPIEPGRKLEVDIWVEGGDAAVGKLEILAFRPGDATRPGSARVRVLSAWREGQSPPAGTSAVQPALSAERAALSSAERTALPGGPTPGGAPTPPGAGAAEPSTSPPGSTPGPGGDATRAARIGGGYSVATRPNLPEEIRKAGEMCAEYTRDLVKLLNRSQYYGDQIASRDADSLIAAYDLLIALIGERHEFGYVVERGSDSAEVFVDGVGEERRKLSAILRPEVAETFVPKLIDYFEKYQIVALAFRKGIARQEWETVLKMMSGLQAPDAASRLADELITAGVTNISLLTTADLVGKDFGIPWQIRVCLARMTRDLGALPMMQKQGAERIRQYRMNMILDVVRPFSGPHQLKQVLVYCAVVQDKTDKIKELGGAKLEDIISEIIRPVSLIGGARNMLEDYRAKRLPDPPFGEERFQHVLKGAALRLATLNLEEGFELLRELYKEKLLRYDELPPDIQEWVDAEDLSRSENPALEAPRDADELRWIRIQSKAARLLVRGDRHELAVPLLVRLLEHAGAKSDAFKQVMDESLPRLVDRFCTGGRGEREGFGYIIKVVGGQAAPFVIEALLAAGADAVSSPPFQLLSTIGAAAAAEIKKSLKEGAAKPGPLRALIMAAGKLLDPQLQMGDAVRPYLRHPDAKIRLQAVIAHAALAGPAAKMALAEALRDKDETVIAQALTLFAQRKEAVPEADGIAAQVMNKPDGLGLLLASLRYAAVSKSDEVHDALAGCVEREQGGGLKRLFGAGGQNRPEVLAAACAGLKAADEGELLDDLLQHADPAVRSAAEAAKATKG